MIEFSVSAHKSDVDNPELIPDSCYEPVIVAFNIGNHSITGQKACMPIILLDI